MSSVFKGVRKIFKKVVKAVKKIAVPLLAAGALIFTGGAALGLAGFTGGWAGAVSTVTAKLGSGLLGKVVTGAITQAGQGALIGGAVSAATGGSFSEGAKAGARVGAITGGLSGGYAHMKSGTPAGPPTTIDPTTGQAIETGAKTYPLSRETMAPIQAIDASGNVVSQATPGASRGLLGRAGKYLTDNPEITGHIIKGVGTGLLSGAAADAERDLVRERFDQIRQNYAGADPGASYRDAAPSGSGQTPSQRFSPSNYGSWEYQYNPQTGRIERTPIGG